MRSKLFVPGSRPELFPKALASDADALAFDLEDSVAPARKAEARLALRDFLRSGALSGSTKTIIVRINAPETPYFAEDILAMTQTGVHMLNLPKPRDTHDIRAASRAMADAQQANGVTAPIGLLVNIETPQALRCAHELAAADPRVMGLQLGLGDLFEPLGIARRDVSAVRQAMFAVRMAAGEAGVFAYDAAFADIRDEAGFLAEAQQARQLGFIGKSCIHPRQIALANAAFRPGDEEIAHALRVVEAAHQADIQGVGAYVVDGKMVDAPFVRRAEALLATATRLGLVAPADAPEARP
ncbi:CoA ester lyase [Polaromonas sp. SM01]|uniref:HpcH/HpaI aldolase/citrate lyase family protein n=1 Tax=Polaromonas sp. SM01 TaxID=3085630 RepID=UPI002981377E|nr:CoA ester lyase [Polaromonas sp. SM01]MDW5442727.1 CoA ester lyase [Polaromonas sp. SM01]